jgi:hypothetical protein
LEVDGIPGTSDAEHQVAETIPHNDKPKNNGIHVFIRTYDGLQIQKKGISYQDLVSLVEKLEGLC